MSTWPSGVIGTSAVDETTDSPTLARADIKTSFDRVNAILGSRGVTNGIPTLGPTGNIPRTELGLTLSNTGGSISGFLTLHATPTALLHAASKQYVDNRGLNDDSVASSHLKDLSVSNLKLGLAAVSSGKVATSGIISADIRDGAIVASKLALDSILTNRIIDGQITNVKIAEGVITDGKMALQTLTDLSIAPGAIHRLQVNAGTGASVSGSGVEKDHTLQDYCFFPSVTQTGAAPSNFQAINTADPSNTTARLRTSASVYAYDNGVITVRYRYIAASDSPEIWLEVNHDGFIQSAWVCEDPTPDGKSGVSVGENNTAIRLHAKDLASLRIPAQAQKQAKARITKQGWNQAHILYRALQIHAQDEAPATWLFESVKYHKGKFSYLSAQEKQRRFNTIPVIQ